MADVLIWGLSDAAVAHIDAAAAARGLSRQEYLRRRFEVDRSQGQSHSKLTLDDLRRAATVAAEYRAQPVDVGLVQSASAAHNDHRGTRWLQPQNT
jgi:hypothetical protein